MAPMLLASNVETGSQKSRPVQLGRALDQIPNLPPSGRTRAPAQSATNCNLSRLHEGISNATSSPITQILSEKIGLNAFLTDRHVPGFAATCDCGDAF
jgi:hypothetical protein